MFCFWPLCVLFYRVFNMPSSLLIAYALFPFCDFSYILLISPLLIIRSYPIKASFTFIIDSWFGVGQFFSGAIGQLHSGGDTFAIVCFRSGNYHHHRHPCYYFSLILLLYIISFFLNLINININTTKENIFLNDNKAC